MHFSNELCLTWCIDQCHLIEIDSAFIFASALSSIPKTMVLDHVLSLHIIKMVSFFFGNAGCVSLVDAGSDVIPDVSWFKLLACITGGNGGGVKC